MVVGTSGLSAEDYAEIDAAARNAERGVIAAGNFSITATLLKRFALAAARYVPDFEIIDYASAAEARHPVGNGARTCRGACRYSTGVRRQSPWPSLSGYGKRAAPRSAQTTPVQVHSLAAARRSCSPARRSSAPPTSG